MSGRFRPELKSPILFLITSADRMPNNFPIAHIWDAGRVGGAACFLRHYDQARFAGKGLGDHEWIAA